MKDDYLDATDPDDEWFPDFLDELEVDKHDGKNIDEFCKKVREYWRDYKEDRAEQEAYEQELQQLARTY